MNLPQGLIAGAVLVERLVVAACGIENITQQPVRARPIGRSRAPVGEQLAKQLLRAPGRAVRQLSRREAQHGIGEARHPRQQLLGPAPRLCVLAVMRGNRGERAHGREVARIELQRTQVTRLRLLQEAERDQGVALVRVRVGELRMALEEGLGMVQRLRRPVAALQAQRERIARRDVLRSQADRSFEQTNGVIELALLLEAGRQYVEQQRMLESIRERLLGDRRGTLDVAVLRMRQNRGQHRLVGLEVACHPSMMPEHGLRPTSTAHPAGAPKKRRASSPP